MLKWLQMTSTQTKPARTPGYRDHSGPTPSPEVLAAHEKQLGIEKADALLSRVYQSGTSDASATLLDAASTASERGRLREASLYSVIALTPEFVTTQRSIDIARATARAQKLRRGAVTPETRQTMRDLRNKLFPFNAALKEYLDFNADTSLTQTTAMLARSYRVMSQKEQVQPRPAVEVTHELSCIARGMRAELAAEQILGNFEDIEIHYYLQDDETQRQYLETKGTDYVITATVLGKPFELAIDIKAKQSDTLDETGNPLRGKLWSQCQDSDYINGSSRIDPRKIGRTYLPMQRALITQITLQYPGELEALCREHATTLEEIDIN